MWTKQQPIFLICTAGSWKKMKMNELGQQQQGLQWRKGPENPLFTYIFPWQVPAATNLCQESKFVWFFLTFLMVSKIAFLPHFNLNSGFRLLRYKPLNFAVSLHSCKTSLYRIIDRISILNHRYEWHLWYWNKCMLESYLPLSVF